MKRLGPVATPFVTAKSAELLKTMPVGMPCPPPVAAGTDTTRLFGTPLPSYSTALPASAEFTQTKPSGLNATPQPSIRFGSMLSAGTEPSDTRLRTA